MRVRPTTFVTESEEAQAHRRRCKALAPLQPGEEERLMAAFLADRNITQCPVRYAAPVEQHQSRTRHPDGQAN
jgi:hypothetical protein